MTTLLEQEEIALELSLFKKKPKKEVIEFSDDDFKKIYKKAIALVKSEVNKLDDDAKKYVKFNDIDPVEDFITDHEFRIFSVDAWDISSKARDDEEYQTKINPIYNKYNALENSLNEIIKKDNSYKYFEFTTDGDWDDWSLYFSMKSQYTTANKEKQDTDANQKFKRTIKPKDCISKAMNLLKEVLNESEFKDVKKYVKIGIIKNNQGFDEKNFAESKDTTFISIGSFNITDKSNIDKNYDLIHKACKEAEKRLNDKTYSIITGLNKVKDFSSGVIDLNRNDYKMKKGLFS